MNLMKSIFISVRAAYRLLFFIIVISIYFITGAFYYAVTGNPVKRRKRLVNNASFYARFMAAAFNMKIICKNLIPADENSLVVGNHVGFIDIVALQALRGCVFITSTEMEQTPVLGQICDVAGCTYVNRKNRMNIQDELKSVVQVLKEDVRVVLYAESVASNGEQVLPFKKTLIMAAGFAERPIRPFVFNFREVNGGPVQYAHRDSLCWYGDESFLEAIWLSLKLDSVTVEIEFLPLVYTKADDDRTITAKKLHDMVSEKFVPFTHDMNLPKEETKMHLQSSFSS